MSEIPDIEIRPISIPGINSAILNHPTFTSPDVPVMVPLGFPIIEMPCVETRRSEYENDALIQNDPDGNVTLCTGSVPSFRAMDYTPEELVITEEAEPQRFEEPETPPTAVATLKRKRRNLKGKPRHLCLAQNLQLPKLDLLSRKKNQSRWQEL